MASVGPNGMQEFTSTQLANNTGDVLAAAAQAPVRIGRHGKARYVMLTVERFEQLVRGQDARRSRRASEPSDAETESLADDLQAPVPPTRMEDGRREIEDGSATTRDVTPPEASTTRQAAVIRDAAADEPRDRV